MKKTLNFLAAMLVLSLAVGVYAAPKRYVPNDQEGTPIGHPLYGGYSYKYVNSTTETLVCSGKCLIAGLIMSTGANTSEVQLRDTNAADAGGGASFRLPRLSYNALDTRALVNPIVLPVVFESGITAKITSVSNGETVAVLYLDLDASQ